MSVQSHSAVGSAVVRPPVSQPRLWDRFADNLTSPLFAVVLIGYWEFHVRFFEVEALLLPPPSQIAISFWKGMTSGLFLSHFGITIFRALTGFAVATVFGIALGALISQFRFVEKTIYPWVV